MSPSYVVIGTPFSTFTRTITSALHFKGLHFDQNPALPHSELARQHHPFGFIPSLIITEGNQSFDLRESQAIARYIDRIAPTPSLVDSHPELPEKVWELVSIIAVFGFRAIEVQVVKPRIKSIDEGQEPPEVSRAYLHSSGGIQGLRDFFEILETLRTGNGPYLLGNSPTWPDLFLYPLISDLLATPDADLVPASIVSWAQVMEEVRGIKETHRGTLADGSRP